MFWFSLRPPSKNRKLKKKKKKEKRIEFYYRYRRYRRYRRRYRRYRRRYRRRGTLCETFVDTYVLCQKILLEEKRTLETRTTSTLPKYTPKRIFVQNMNINSLTSNDITELISSLMKVELRSQLVNFKGELKREL